MSFHPQMIAPYRSGLKKSEKPFLILDDAFQTIENAYVWRERVKKRLGIKLVNRLRRVLTGQALGNTDGSGNFSGNIFTILGLDTAAPNAGIELGSVTITVGAQIFNEPGTPNGLLSNGAAGTGTINYATGGLTLNTDPNLAATAVSIDFNYFPNLPVMGIKLRELGAINVEDSVFWDTVFVYQFDSVNNTFSSPSTTVWSGSDSQYFWSENYRGSDASTRLFFATNGASPALSANNRIRYTTDVVTWTTFTPQVNNAGTTFIWQCKLIVAYYGRLLFLNTWEGANAAGALNYFNRCRFSQIGDPTQVDAWESDTFGKGGFIDAPTNEIIVSAQFYKNTLIVFFEKSTWQLRYVGEYGLPFLWERISSDYGSESTFSTVLFDEGVLAVGDKAILTSSGNNVQRIDLNIPDQVYQISNEDNGKERVQGIRDFQKQLVYWSFKLSGTYGNFANRVLVYNYINQSWAIFRDNISSFGILQTGGGDSWDDPISWDSETPWDNIFTVEFPAIVSGNQQGFVHYYQYPPTLNSVSISEVPFKEQESLYIESVTLSDTNPITIGSPEHNLVDGDFIYITGMLFVNTSGAGSALSTTLNDKFYTVTRVNDDEFTISEWDTTIQDYITTSRNNIGYDPDPAVATYFGGGVIALFPVMNVFTKDFNPYQQMGVKWKSSFTDFQFDATPNAFVTMNIYCDSALNTVINSPVYNTKLNTSTNLTGTITGATQANPCVITSPSHGLSSGRTVTINDVLGMTSLNNNQYTVTVINLNTFSLNVNSTLFGAYTSGGYWQTTDDSFFYQIGSNYSWHRFYSNVFGQYITFQMTYNDALMNDPNTHRTDIELNAMTIYSKPAGRFS